MKLKKWVMIELAVAGAVILILASPENPATIRGWLKAAMMWLVSPTK